MDFGQGYISGPIFFNRHQTEVSNQAKVLQLDFEDSIIGLHVNRRDLSRDLCASLEVSAPNSSLKGSALRLNLFASRSIICRSQIGSKEFP